MRKITTRAIALWRELPESVLNQMPYSYEIRGILAKEFSVSHAKAHNCSLAAVRIIKSGAKPTGGQKKGTRKKPVEDRKVKFSCWLTPEAREKLRQVAQAGPESQGGIVVRLIEDNLCSFR